MRSQSKLNPKSINTFLLDIILEIIYLLKRFLGSQKKLKSNILIKRRMINYLDLWNLGNFGIKKWWKELNSMNKMLKMNLSLRKEKLIMKSIGKVLLVQLGRVLMVLDYPLIIHALLGKFLNKKSLCEVLKLNKNILIECVW